MVRTTAESSKRARILETALALVAVKGVDGFSVKQLADKARVGVGTLYLYFDDRKDLIRQLRAHTLRLVAQTLCPRDPSQPLKDQYRDLCNRYWAFSLAHPDMTLSDAQFDCFPSEDDGVAAFRPMWDMFERGRVQGRIKKLPDTVLYTLGIAPYRGLACRKILGLTASNEPDIANVIEATWDAIAVTVPEVRTGKFGVCGAY